MPNRDGTGPEGKGPRTGRGLGDCEPSENEGNANAESNVPRGRGLGPCGRGLGRGRRFNGRQ